MTKTVFARTEQAQTVKEGSVLVRGNCGIERLWSPFPDRICDRIDPTTRQEPLTSLESGSKIMNDSLPVVASESIWEIPAIYYGSLLHSATAGARVAKALLT